MTNEDAVEWISKLFEVPAKYLSAETSRDDIPAWDSLGVLTLMAGLDNDFGIQLSDDEVQRMKTVGDILGVLRQHGTLV